MQQEPSSAELVAADASQDKNSSGDDAAVESSLSVREAQRAELTPGEGEATGSDFAVVGIGASAGGLAALKIFFGLVPSDCNLAFVVVVHLSPEHESHLAELLQPHVKMPVRQVTETVRLERNCVFVIPPGRNISAVDTHLRLSDLEERRRERAPIDHFFRTLAQTYDGDSVAVVLTGTGSDGTLGIREIRERGGLTIVQDPNDAEFDGMPRSAVATGVADMILPLEEIPSAILRYEQISPRLPVTHEVDELAAEQRQLLHKIYAQIRARHGRDFSRYKVSTILRRVQRRMQISEVEELADYVALLREQPAETHLLAEDLLITVSNFFRDPDVFVSLRTVVEQLFEGKTANDSVRVWSVGCATGEEAYSLAIMLLEHASSLEESPRLQVFASDLHERSLERAREGFYPGDIEADVSAERLRRYFQREDGGYRIRKEVRELVVFAPHNLLSDPPFSKIDLISCRNVLIYLQRDVQKEVIELFHYSLRPEGFMVLGTSETTDGLELFRVIDKKSCLYAKRNVLVAEPRLPVFPVTHHRLPGHGGHSEPYSEPVAYGALHQRMVEEYAPPSLLISPDDRIVHLSQNVGRFLVHPGGELTSNVLKLVRDEFRIELRSALLAARERSGPVRSQPISVRLESRTASVCIDVRPAPGRQQDGYALIIFDEQPERRRLGSPESSSSPQPLSSGETGDRVREMDAELSLARQRLQAMIEEYETGQEEMKAANEELQSANEELRSTLEELETSKEELQSMNEELQTVNQENRHKVEELAQLSSDLQNLLAATDIATLFLDRDFRILRFTPKVSELFNVRPVDRGRPISDLTHRLGYTGLIADVEAVLLRLVPIEHEVQDQENRWYLARLLPYRSREDRIEGVVITFVEITHRKRSEEALRGSEEQLRQLNQHLELQVAERTASVRLLQDVTRIANEARSVEDALRDSLQVILEADHWDVGHAWSPVDGSESIFASVGYWRRRSTTGGDASATDRLLRGLESLRGSTDRSMLERVLAAGEPIWFRDLSTQDDSATPAGGVHGFRAAGAFPVVADGRTVAVLELYAIAPRELNLRLLEVLQAIGIQLGHVVKRKGLEKLVADAAEREQRRIGSDIHDGVGQELTGLRHLAQTHAEMLAEQNSPEAAIAHRIAGGFETVQKQLRAIIRDLMPVEVDGEGLIAALRRLADRVGEAYNLDCALYCPQSMSVENNLAATHIFRIAQEAVSNAAKHARPSEVSIRLNQLKGELILQIIDDGVGITRRPDQDCFGISTMNSRAELLGGTLQISPGSSGGTEVTFSMPLKKLAADGRGS